jgi:hypothetical protein
MQSMIYRGTGVPPVIHGRDGRATILFRNKDDKQSTLHAPFL